ncbi:hypothetical protein FRC08_009772 [Ceratobasidium sp. 394]|nr:hypothetical protein FRC08_009772 [Ceratobasidium sp. 394]
MIAIALARILVDWLIARRSFARMVLRTMLSGASHIIDSDIAQSGRRTDPGLGSTILFGCSGRGEYQSWDLWSLLGLPVHGPARYQPLRGKIILGNCIRGCLTQSILVFSNSGSILNVLRFLFV